MKMKSIYSKLVLVSLLLATISGTVSARECTECKKTNAKNASVQTKAAVCKRAQSTAELNINNVRALINGYGNMWYDGSVTQYHIPKNSNTAPLYCAALWIGGTDVNDQLRLAALRFGQDGDDYWPGPLKINGTASIDLPVCNAYDKHWIITKAEVLNLKSYFVYDEEEQTVSLRGDNPPDEVFTDVIANWPAKGEGDDLSSFLAPFYDADGDLEYNPRNGDYPYYDFDNKLCPKTLKANLPAGENYVTTPTMETEANIVNGGILSDQVLKGDQTIWWIFNDMGNVHTESGGQPIGLEIRAQAFAFATNDEINNMTFYSYEIINRSTYELRETYFSQWVDPDLGNATDDYVGCDVRRGLGYCYNGTAHDKAGAGSYSGIPPAVGIDFFQGPYMDADGKDNPKINIPWIKTNGNPKVQLLLSRYLLADGSYDTIAISDDADLFYNADKMSWVNPANTPNDEVAWCAINGVNFGNNIVDDERFGMRRFVYYNNTTSGINSEPRKATDYYNYLRGLWNNNSRMKYGGDATSGTLECDFMFPGDSDPWHWGTKGVVPENDAETWTEYNMADNAPSDRRFMQSAGPFTLKPGALNYITVGIPFAQATTGDQWSSVEQLRLIDDVCQSLFENCFKVLDGPDAPTLTCQELNNEIILYLTYENSESNNYGEKYSEIDPAITRSYFDEDGNTVPYTDDERSYKFEGYQIYQLVDANASVSDIGDITKARQVAQCDIENYYDEARTIPIGTLTNFSRNTATGILSGQIMVEGANKGIQHVFRITTDQFATGQNTKLVNNREYYFVAIAYAQNRYMEYSQTEAAYLDGQKEPYLAGRKNENGGSITAITAIPHNPVAEAGGRIAQSEFGMCPNIIRLEGFGNGGNELRLTNQSIVELMGAPNSPAKEPGVFVEDVASNGMTDNSYMTNPCIIPNPQYEENYGPINVRVIDPLKIKPGNYNILFTNTDGTTGISGDTRWRIVSADGGQIPVNEGGTIVYKDVVESDFAISRYNEQLFLDLGIAVTLVNPEAAATDLYKAGYSDNLLSKYYEGFVNNGALLGSKMTFSDENKQWLSGIPDNDSYLVRNWIRSGSQYAVETYSSFSGSSLEYNINEAYLDEDYFKAYQPAGQNPQSSGIDKEQIFEDVVGGLWAPYGLVSTMPFHPGFNFSYYMADKKIIDSLFALGRTTVNGNRVQRQLMTNFYSKALNYNDIAQLPSVRIVLTADATKWTRCPVIEECDDYTQSEGNARKFSARMHASVDKHGKTCEDLGIAPDVDDPENPAYISENGMGWFPGYAINTVTGERLNIMFGEDSRYVQHNGRDMLWNPDAEMTEGTQNYVLGGRHFVYVMNSCNQPFVNMKTGVVENVRYRTPSYDGGRWAMKMLSSVERLMNKISYNAGFYSLYNGVIDNTSTGVAVRDSIAMLYSSVAWVNMPLISPRYSFYYPGDDATLNANSRSNGIPCDVTIDIDVRTPYGLNMSNGGTTAAHCGLSNLNNNMPAYQFRLSERDAVIDNLATTGNDAKTYADSLLNMINVVPNPYYSYSYYETTSQLETKVRIINLPTGIENGKPQGCLIRIYTVDGTLVRTIGPTAVSREVSDGHYAESTSVDWDLHNHTGIPIAGGVYLIHVSVPGIGERVIKWFGTMRPVDVQAFQF
jgi:hypothetical protein